MAVILLVAVEAAEAIVRKPAGFIDTDKAQATLIYVRIGPGGEPQPVCGSPDIAFVVQTDMPVCKNIAPAVQPLPEVGV